ncbi:hypothetical protein [Streptomyces sp. MI02-7b]|uniref:hypothetical protein n=1 Tax=Streptomyces sp. MI02-7b TaxID=462941 RepID=UPI0029B12153|nr:hypothetical protein [Streptomyces sp. MI02-7b]MDX3074583.1 hypothetical protein [Streptomyces sp. MI02-7b]
MTTVTLLYVLGYGVAAWILLGLVDLLADRDDQQLAATGPRQTTTTTAPCHCGRRIPTGRIAYCSDRCRWNDDNHGSN